MAGRSHALRVQFVNARTTKPTSVAAPSGAQRAVPLSQVTYRNLWDGVTLTYDAPSGAVVRSTYRVEPFANAGHIRLRYNAPVTVQDDGSLRVNFETGTVNESAPIAWQEREGKRLPVRIAFAPPENGELTFAVGEYDRSEPLFIDPTLTWNTFLGSATDDMGEGLAVDVSGNVYVAGASDASWGSPVSPHSGGYDAFVAKLDFNGNLIWHTFVGGAGNEGASGVAVDGSGNVYLGGWGYAAFGVPVRTFGGVKDAFAAKLDSSGNLIWNTFLGSGADDTGNAVSADLAGNVYVAGYSSATWHSPVRAFSGIYDGFAAKLDSNGALIWNTFLGSDKTDHGNSLAVDPTGNVYVVGFSKASWGSPVRAFEGVDGAFAAKLDPSGTLIWNTFLGGGGNDAALDGSGNLYVAGNCIAGWGSPVRAFSGPHDALVAKLNIITGTLAWHTFLGTSGEECSGWGVAADASGNVYVAGNSSGSWGTPARPYSGSTAGSDAFAAQLDSNGALTWNTFFAASEGNAVAVDHLTGNVYLTGDSSMSWGSPVREYGGGGLHDAYLAKIPVSNETPTPTPSPAASPTPDPTPSPDPTPTPTATPNPTPAPVFQGSFVIGDGEAVVGKRVTFWGAQWANLNSVSGGPAPASFKGFTSSASTNPPACGGAWTSTPGNSSGPPSSVPQFITVLVASSITKSGPTITGNIPQIVIVQTDPGYGPSPGHTGTGTVVAVYCQ